MLLHFTAFYLRWFKIPFEKVLGFLISHCYAIVLNNPFKYITSAHVKRHIYFPNKFVLLPTMGFG